MCLIWVQIEIYTYIFQNVFLRCHNMISIIYVYNVFFLFSYVWHTQIYIGLNLYIFLDITKGNTFYLKPLMRRFFLLIRLLCVVLFLTKMVSCSTGWCQNRLPPLVSCPTLDGELPYVRVCLSRGWGGGAGMEDLSHRGKKGSHRSVKIM